MDIHRTGDELVVAHGSEDIIVSNTMKCRNYFQKIYNAYFEWPSEDNLPLFIVLQLVTMEDKALRQLGWMLKVVFKEKVFKSSQLHNEKIKDMRRKVVFLVNE